MNIHVVKYFKSLFLPRYWWLLFGLPWTQGLALGLDSWIRPPCLALVSSLCVHKRTKKNRLECSEQNKGYHQVSGGSRDGRPPPPPPLVKKHVNFTFFWRCPHSPPPLFLAAKGGAGAIFQIFEGQEKKLGLWPLCFELNCNTLPTCIPCHFCLWPSLNWRGQSTHDLVELSSFHLHVHVHVPNTLTYKDS